ncbi:ankyrin repeat domain-containing protein [Chitinophaga alhagiae]|uniref:ankyrin repeat domain-containing protein n=1 Tax=Chitinophaga alhagiae TaxID=2203219 RepID=UPI000E5B35E6|nr:ankyrin repeat domain-containing protein [Chitinophaga alhagiae]
MTALLNALKTRNLDLAATLAGQGEQLPGNLPDYEIRQLFGNLLQAKAYPLLLHLVNGGFIETDIYEYGKLEDGVFEVLLRWVNEEEERLQFLRDFLSKLDNVGDAVQDKTLLDIAFSLQAPISAIRILVDAGCDLHRKNNAEANHLYKVVQEFSIKEERGLEYIAYLLNEGMDVNEGNVVGETPLHLAINKNKKRYIQLLLEKGADLNQPDAKGETPLYGAVVHQVCDADTYRSLTAFAPPDFEQATKDGETLLLGAVRMRRSGNEQEAGLLTALLNDGADLYQTAPHYGKAKSALDWICEKPSGLLNAALSAGAADVHRRDDEGNTLLHHVCAYNVNYEQEAARQLYRKVKLLIAAGADPNATNDQDQTPLMLAVQDNLKAKTVELLLKHKA